MKSIKNLTHSFLRVHLPGGKVLHLGPGHTGQIAESAGEHPPVKKLIEEGKIQIVGEGTYHPTMSDRSPGPVKRADGHHPREKGHQRGDR